jgi:hypothetical protein
MLAVPSLGATSIQQQVGDYVSVFVGTSKIGNSDFERPQHRPFDAATVLAFGNLQLADISHIKFDRKQNTRLWPFVFTGITRSPPLSIPNR